MKRVGSFLLVAALCMSFLPARAAESVTAQPTNQTVYLAREGRQDRWDPYPGALPLYAINGNNYAKLRDVAQAIGFGVTWTPDRPQAMYLYSDQDYDGTQVSTSSHLSPAQAVPSAMELWVDGELVGRDELTVYMIGDNNYFKLRDLARLLNFGCKYVSGEDAVVLSRDFGYDEDNRFGKPRGQEGVENPYTPEYLSALVESTAPDPEVTAFREADNGKREGLLKYSFRFFDLYYPDTPEAEACLELLKPHGDKVYMMLTDLYGLQARAEPHLIDEADTQGQREGDLRAQHHITLIWLEENNDGGGNNLAEFIHEMNHCFYNEANGNATNEMWLNEANAKMISSVYTEYNYDGPVDQWTFAPAEFSFLKRADLLSFERVDALLSQARAWSKAEGDLNTAQGMGLCYWSMLYNTSSLDQFKLYLRNLGNGPVLPALERLTGMTAKEIDAQLQNYIISLP